MSIEYPKILTKGFKSALEHTPIQNGKIRFATDTNQLFIDDDGVRKEITDFITDYTESAIKQLMAPLPKAYISSDTHKLFMYLTGQGWICLSNDAANASTAQYAVNAGSASYSKNAEIAETANYVVNASTADYSYNAGTAKCAAYDANGRLINTTYAPLDSPIFTGLPQAPTPASGSVDNQVANTEFVSNTITQALSSVTSFELSVVDSFESLPEQGKTGTFYLVPNSGSEENNLYDEYIWINDKYECIDRAKLDLSEYYKEYEVTGTGNAVTGVSVENGKITFKKDISFLTQHPTITTSSSTYSESPNAGDSIEIIDSIQLDSNGHLQSYRKKTVKLPAAISNATTASSGLMTAEMAMKLANIEAGAQKNTVLGIKGEKESAYRSGNVSLSATNVGALPVDGGTMQDTIHSNVVTNTHLNGNDGLTMVNSTADAGSYVMLDRLNSTNGHFTDGVYQKKRIFQYTANGTTSNTVTKSLTLLDEDGNSEFPGLVTSNGGFSGNLTGKATTATIALNGVAVQASAPAANTAPLLWVDTANSNILKFRTTNSSTVWTQVSSVWT